MCLLDGSCPGPRLPRLCWLFDWSEPHHDVEVQDPDGRVLDRARVADGVDGIGRLHALLSEHADDPTDVVMGIEIDRGMLVGGLVAAGYRVFAVNPKSVDRYRDRHRLSGAKSDAGDAKVLADLVRTDRHNHGPSPATVSWPRRSS